jgi:hypothetical protein
MRNTCLQSSTFEIMTAFLFLPASRSSPLLNETIPVGLDERLVLVIPRFEKEWYTYHRESNRTRRAGKRFLEDLFYSPVQMLLPNVPVGSESVRDELDRDNQGLRSGGRESCHRTIGTFQRNRKSRGKHCQHFRFYRECSGNDAFSINNMLPSWKVRTQ